ncbi:MAG TPA: DUF5915 domain-containing protein, partial [Ktedonobacterales bacterium]|nr:DUF5915 domain-containing protein [Ktedonobacterales bacterium]
PQLGKRLPKVLAALRELDPHAVAQALRDSGALGLTVDGETVELGPHEVEVEASARAGYVAAEDRGYVVVLETTLTPELWEEGLVRDLTHLVQETRKHAGFAIEDTIELQLATDTELAAIVERYAGYIKEETLARRLTVVVTDGATEGAPGAGGYTETIPAAKLGGHAVTVTVRRAE